MWYQFHKRDQKFITWSKFKQEVIAQYDDLEFEDPFEELAKFKQTRSVQEFYQQFIMLVTKAEEISVK